MKKKYRGYSSFEYFNVGTTYFVEMWWFLTQTNIETPGVLFDNCDHGPFSYSLLITR